MREAWRAPTLRAAALRGSRQQRVEVKSASRVVSLAVVSKHVLEQSAAVRGRKRVGGKAMCGARGLSKRAPSPWFSRAVYAQRCVDGQAPRGAFACSTPATLKPSVQRSRMSASGFYETSDPVRSATEPPTAASLTRESKARRPSSAID